MYDLAQIKRYAAAGVDIQNSVGDISDVATAYCSDNNRYDHDVANRAMKSLQDKLSNFINKLEQYATLAKLLEQQLDSHAGVITAQIKAFKSVVPDGLLPESEWQAFDSVVNDVFVQLDAFKKQTADCDVPTP